MKINKNKLPIVFRGVFIACLFCLLSVAVVVFMNSSVAWFSENRSVTSNGQTVTLKDYGITDTYSYKTKTDAEFVKIENWAHVFENLVPGDTVEIRAEYVNEGDQTRTLTPYFVGNETPLVKTVDGKTQYYYFGSQLKITQVIENGGTPINKNTFLITPPTNQLYFTETQTLKDIELGSQFEIAPGNNYTIEFTVLFVNLDINQNDYKDFGAEDGSGSCLWKVVAILSDITT